MSSRVLASEFATQHCSKMRSTNNNPVREASRRQAVTGCSLKALSRRRHGISWQSQSGLRTRRYADTPSARRAVASFASNAESSRSRASDMNGALEKKHLSSMVPQALAERRSKQCLRVCVLESKVFLHTGHFGPATNLEGRERSPWALLQ